MEIPNGHNQEMALIHPPPSNFPQQEKMMPKYQQNQILAPNYSCPRCDSTNTKFCYYNNYSLSQPRYFCKACRRYWTKGGILRNVPVGGGCRKNKIRPSDDSSAAAFTTKKSLLSPSAFQNINITKLPPAESTPNFRIPNDGLTLAFNPFLIDEQNPNNPNPSFLDILRGGGVVGPAGQESHRGGPPSLCYGFGNHHHQRGVLNFHAGGTAPLTADPAPGMAVVGDEEEDDDNVAAAGLGLEITGGRDYWNDGAGSVSSSSSTWHGLVNGSFL